jgi:energy-coupling factor transporter ATP-binding protein EcfA2
MKEQITKLRELVGRIDAWRQSRGLSKNKLCQRFGQLGSTKTYGRILDPSDDLDGMNIESQLENYEAGWELIQIVKDDPEESRLYSDFGWVRETLITVQEALDSPDTSRLVLITGQTGAGKSSLLDLLQQARATANIMYRVEATEAWRQSINELLGALLTEIGIGRHGDREDGGSGACLAIPSGPGARLREVLDRLDSRRVILAIDEAHHIGPAGYNIVKTLINQTRAVVVMTAIPALIARINKSSHDEASQLFYNRLYQHIRLRGPEAGDALDFMKRRGVKFANPADASAIAAKMTTDAVGAGLWKFVVRCTRAAKQSGAPLTQDSFATLLSRVKRSISLGG